jgi:hypothetical protein
LANSDGREDHNNRCGLDSDSSQGSYITVIPVEFSRRSAYPPPAPDYLVEQYRSEILIKSKILLTQFWYMYYSPPYSEYLRERARDEYLRGDYNINSEPQYEESGPLYTLTQRYDHTPNYSPHGSEREWEQRTTPAPMQQQQQQQPLPQEPSPTENQSPQPEQSQPSVQIKKSKSPVHIQLNPKQPLPIGPKWTDYPYPSSPSPGSATPIFA